MRLPYDNPVVEYLSDLRLRNPSANTISIYGMVLRYFGQHVRRGQPDAEILLSAITPEAAKAFVAYRMGQQRINVGHATKPVQERPLSIATVHQEVRSPRIFGAWLAKNGYPNPFQELKTPKLPKRLIEILTAEEISALFRAYNPSTHIGARWQAILAFFLDTGCASRSSSP